MLLRAKHYKLLTLTAEAVCALMRPLRWLHTYVPVLPDSQAAFVEAPTPFIMGLHSSVPLEGVDHSGTFVVDLDQDQVPRAALDKLLLTR